MAKREFRLQAPKRCHAWQFFHACRLAKRRGRRKKKKRKERKKRRERGGEKRRGRVECKLMQLTGRESPDQSTNTVGLLLAGAQCLLCCQTLGWRLFVYVPDNSISPNKTSLVLALPFVWHFNPLALLFVWHFNCSIWVLILSSAGVGADPMPRTGIDCYA